MSTHYSESPKSQMLDVLKEAFNKGNLGGGVCSSAKRYCSCWFYAAGSLYRWLFAGVVWGILFSVEMSALSSGWP